MALLHKIKSFKLGKEGRVQVHRQQIKVVLCILRGEGIGRMVRS